jgi:exodeoxyribonuclease-5
MDASRFLTWRPPAVTVTRQDDAAGPPEGFEMPSAVQVLAPTNRAVAVLRGKGIPGATTVHSAIYRAVLQQPRTRLLIEWLKGDLRRPDLPTPSDFAHLDEAGRAEARRAFHDALGACGVSFPAAADQFALAAAMRAAGLDPFILLDTTKGNGGWLPREEVPCKVRIADESSMLTLRTARDVLEGTRAVLFVGDPRQLDPVVTDQDRRDAGADNIDRITPFMRAKGSIATHYRLRDPMRQTGIGSAGGQAILEIANWLGGAIDRGASPPWRDIWSAVQASPGFVVTTEWPARVLREAPAIVWRNTTRLATIAAFREVMGYPPGELMPGEPVILDWIRGGREAEKRFGHSGLVRNSNWTVVQGSQSATWRLRGADGREVYGVDGRLSEHAAQVQAFAERHPKRAASPWANFSIGSGRALYFQHGAASTCHRAQGGEWDEVAISIADLCAYFRSPYRHTTGAPAAAAWFYTAMTRARHRVHLVVGEEPAVVRDFVEH